jgi:peptidyl-prolyl cis-trans isomerase SurA
MKRVAQNNNMSLSQFKEAAEQHGLKYSQLKHRIRSQKLAEKVRSQSVMSKIAITPDDVNQYMHTHDLQKGVESAYRFREIVSDTGSHPGKTRRKMEKLRKRAGKGANFAKLARHASSKKNAENGGLVKWTPAHRLPKSVANALSDLDEGGISDVVENGKHLVLLKMLGRRPTDSSHDSGSVTQVKVRHIVIQPNEIRSHKKSKALAGRLRREIKAGGSFASVAKKYSDDKTSSNDGGKLGWITLNRVNPKTRKILENLKSGQVSKVLSAANGYEIIKVQKRRTRNEAEQQRRNKARQTLGMQQAKEQSKVWMHELRDRAYIDIRIKNYQPENGA